MGTAKNQETRQLTRAEFIAAREALKADMRKELAPVEAKYWQAVQETNLLNERMRLLYEAYRALWEEKVVPHRTARNNIYRKYRRRLKKLEERLHKEELMRY